jgi:ABC-type glutathione transport system ATPase component
MPKITLIVGLCGSGKTYLANIIKKFSQQFRPTVLFDDIKKDDFEKVKVAVKQNKDIIITDPWLCYPKELSKAKEMLEKLGTIDIIYFENDPEACLENIKRRNDGRKVEGFNKHATKYYTVPSGIISCKVYVKS